MQITSSAQNKMVVMSANICPFFFNIVRFSGLGTFSEGRFRNLLDCHLVPCKKSYALFVRAVVLLRSCASIY